MTYRVLLAFFPLLLFLISLLAMLDVDESAILGGLFYVLPGDIAKLVADFFDEIGVVGGTGLMSTALFFSVHNSSAGFRAILRIAGHSHEREHRRSFVVQVGFSLVLMLLFSATLIIMLGLLVFRRQIWGIFFPTAPEFLFEVASAAVAIFVLTVVVTIFFKLASRASKGFKHLLPGAVLTVVSWLVLSYFFGFAISNFTQYSAIYGSISGIFVLILWLNAISLVLLLGNEVNFVLAFDKTGVVG